MRQAPLADDAIERIDVAPARIHQRRTVWLFDPSNVGGEFAGQPVVIRVQKREITPAGPRGAGIARGALATVRLTNRRDVRAEASQDRRGGIGRFVVDDDY